MQFVVFVGLQGSGKSTFYARRFADTHVLINLDMLRTRHRERILFEACLAAKQPVVIDNTNPTPADRARYVVPARAACFSVIGYYFQSQVQECMRRNLQRPPQRVVPLGGVMGTAGRMVLPTPAEGFDSLQHVRIDEAGEFVVEAWREDV